MPPTVPPYPPGEHPAWCDQKHPNQFRAHAGKVGEVHVGDLSLSLTLVDYEDEAGTLFQVTFTVAYEDPWTVDLVPDAALALRDLIREGDRIRLGAK